MSSTATSTKIQTPVIALECEHSLANSGDTRPQHAEIAQCAYEIFIERGSAHGRDVGDWLQAECELRRAAIGNGAVCLLPRQGTVEE
jgi:hypothetical protein